MESILDHKLVKMLIFDQKVLEVANIHNEQSSLVPSYVLAVPWPILTNKCKAKII